MFDLFKFRINFKILFIVLAVSSTFLIPAGIILYKKASSQIKNQAIKNIISFENTINSKIQSTIKQKEKFGLTLNKMFHDRLLSKKTAIKGYNNLTKETDNTIRIIEKNTGAYVPSYVKINKSDENFLIKSKEFQLHLLPVVKLFFLNIWYTKSNSIFRLSPPGNWISDIEAEHIAQKDPFYYLADAEHDPKRQPVWTPMYYDEHLETWITSLIIPDYKNNTLVGVSGNDYNLNKIFQDFLIHIHESEFKTFLFNNKGEIIVHSDFNKKGEVLRTLPKIDNIKNKNLALFLDNYLQNKKSKPFIMTKSEYNCNKTFVAQPVGFLSWNIGVEVDNTKLFKEINTLFFCIIIGTIFLSIILALSIFFGLNKFVIKRLIKLKEQTKKYIPGNDFHVNASGNDEISELTKAFNNLSLLINKKILLETLISDISREFNNVTSDNIDKLIKIGLQKIGEFAEADRALIFKFSNNYKTMDNIHEWHKEDLASKKEFYTLFKTSNLKWFTKKMISLEPVIINDLDTVHENAKKDKQFITNTLINPDTVKSLICYPISYDNELFGFIGFVKVKEAKEWDKQSLRILEIVGQIFINALKRCQKDGKLAQGKQYLKTIINAMPAILVGVNKFMTITQWNEKATEITGFKEDYAIGKQLDIAMPFINNQINDIKSVIKTSEYIKKSNIPMVINNQETFQNILIFPIHSENSNGAIIYISDVTKQYQNENIVAQNTKLDAIGQLTGGVAHDFNNMLSGIMGAAELLSINISEKNKKQVNLIINTVDRATDLTTKLLAFSRKGTQDISNINIHLTLEYTIDILRRSIDKKIRIISEFNATKKIISGDNSALQSIFMNLGINGSHAMEKGGNLYFKTDNIILDQEYCKNSKFKLNPGTFLIIEIKDTGTGIPKNLINKIFEPFFTTKEQGKGTGLGLAAVYGTTLDHNGAITVESKEGVGTVFRIYLPCLETEPNSEILKPNKKVKINQGSGLILVIDDEEIIRETSKTLLKELGYNVITADNGYSGVEVYKLEHDRIDVVILDMIMPEMNGTEAFYKLKKINKDAKIIIASGYLKDNDLNQLKSSGLSGYLRKPFKFEELSQIIFDLLK